MTYSPRGESEVDRQSRELCYAIKAADRTQISDVIAKIKSDRLPEFDRFFHNGTVFVPIPRSNAAISPEKWPAKLIADELVANRFAMGVEAILRRASEINKSAFSESKNRPNPEDHARTLNSIEAHSDLPLQITLIDDVFTRGSTILGAAKVLRQAFPNAMIRAFTLFWTCGKFEKLKTMKVPVTGRLKIGIRGQPVRRKQKIQLQVDDKAP